MESPEHGGAGPGRVAPVPTSVLDPRHAAAVRRAAWVSVAFAVLSLLVTTAVWYAVGRDAPRPVAGAVGPAHVEVLRGWDRRRAQAWSDGDPAALRRLYVAGSAAGRRDVRMLRRYRDRGLRVEGLETQLVRVALVEEEPDRLLLDVVDRVTAAEVVGEGLRRALPQDQPSRRIVELRRQDGSWLVGEVTDVADETEEP